MGKIREELGLWLLAIAFWLLELEIMPYSEYVKQEQDDE